MNESLDYDLHGIVGIRLLGAAPADATAVTGQLGPIHAPLGREPDIVIRFVDRLSISGGLHYLGVDEAGFTDDAFLVLRSKHKAHARVKIAFDQIGKRCEIICERGLPAVPLLIPILNLTALAKGVLPLHACAFIYNGVGVVATGWSKGGKTETLLAFMSRGARYVGDEWIYISGDGDRVYGIPEPIRMWDWHLRDLPEYRAVVKRGERARLMVLRLAQSAGRVNSRIARNGSGPLKVFSRLAAVLKRQLYVDIPPERLFSGGVVSLSGTFDRLFFVVSHESPDVTVRPVDPQEVARRIQFSLQHERQDFMSYYMKFRFAFPDARNEFIERVDEFQLDLLRQALAEKEAYAVFHPYPVPIPQLFDALSPFC